VLISLFFVNLSWISANIFTTDAIILSVINVSHIYSSYEGFANLDSGVAFSIFNIYPLIILLMSGVTWKYEYFYAIVGLILFIYSSYLNRIKNHNDNDIFMENFAYGFGMMIIAAITEAMIYFLVKNLKTDNNWNQLFITYFLGAILSSIWVIKKYLLNNEENFYNEQINSINQQESVESSKNKLVSSVQLAIIINGLIGTIGYWLRFYSLNRLDTSTYAILSFFGIIMAYFYGIMIEGETIDLYKILGTALIIFSNYQII
jgi:drug/metabolite transporter (DMT)-like permease